MVGPDLSAETEIRVLLSFHREDVAEVRRILRDECGNNLPFCENSDSLQLERVRFAALKLSEGDKGKFHRAVQLAQQDWRDLLIAAGFADDTEAYQSWVPTRKTGR